jgi:hypothetical protein
MFPWSTRLPGLLFDPLQEENRKFFGTGVYLGVMTFVSACRMAVDSNCYRARTRNVARRNGNQNKANTYARKYSFLGAEDFDEE